MLVTGEGGIGKTRLVAELAHRMPAFQVLYGRCDEEELFPFGPWIDMLRPHLARMPQPELAELVRGAPELARLLPEIHERLPDLAGLPPVGEPETRRRQMFGAVVAVVRRLAADGPVLMIVDDLHWADRSSLLLARHVAQRAAARGGPDGRHVPRLRAAARAIRCPSCSPSSSAGASCRACASTAWTSGRSRS